MRKRNAFTMVELPAMSKRGFTLVELLVVMGIISVLVAMLLPALSRAREQARLTRCMSGARQAFFAVQMYCDDFKGCYPTAHQPVLEYHFPPYPLPIWHALLSDMHYLKQDTQTNRGGCPYGPDVFNPSAGNDYSPDAAAPYVSYGLNPHLQNGYGYKPDGVPSYYCYWKTWRTSSPAVRKNSSYVGVIFCSVTPWTWESTIMYPSKYSALGIQPNPYLPNARPYRHEGKGAPVACADGHVDFVTRDEIVSTLFSPNRFGTQIEYYSTWNLNFLLTNP